MIVCTWFSLFEIMILLSINKRLSHMMLDYLVAVPNV